MYCSVTQGVRFILAPDAGRAARGQPPVYAYPARTSHARGEIDLAWENPGKQWLYWLYREPISPGCLNVGRERARVVRISLYCSGRPPTAGESCATSWHDSPSPEHGLRNHDVRDILV